MLLQAEGNPVAVAGTLLLLSLYLAGTAHLAARNVLGDVSPRSALVVGPVPALVAVVGVTLELSPVITLSVAVVLDAIAINRVYDRDPKLSAYIAFIHVVITILLSVVIGGIVVLLATRP